MKELILSVAILAGSLAGLAQDPEDYSSDKGEMKTLFSGSNSVGGYGAISMQYTTIDDRDAFIFGARGGVVLGHLVTLGLGGSGFFNDVHYDSNLGNDISLAGGYGGFFFEPVIFSNYPVHVAFPILIGAGGVAVVSMQGEDWDDEFWSEASDAYMVVTPGVELEVNVTRFFRFCAGAYYRYTSDINIQYPLDYEIPSDILRGWSGGVTFKFGKF
jgi:hypothetical protein